VGPLVLDSMTCPGATSWHASPHGSCDPRRQVESHTRSEWCRRIAVQAVVTRTSGGSTATWVLLEGASDVAAVRAVATTAGVELASHAVSLIDMGGATNIHRHLAAATAYRHDLRVLGLCDLQEAPYIVRALRRVGVPVDSTADLPAAGFSVCDRDLEDELIRALGAGGTQQVLQRLGLAQRFSIFAQQPAWVAKPFEDQVHRFAGSASGRKELLAAALGAALDLGSVPAPLSELLDGLSRPGPTFSESRRPRTAAD